MKERGISVKVRITDELAQQIVDSAKVVVGWRRRTLQSWKFAKL